MKDRLALGTKTVEARLIALAKEYAELGKAIKLPQQHNEIGRSDKAPWRKEGRKIRVYFADNYSVWAVYFGEHPRSVEVVGYAQNIVIPWAITHKEMEDIYDDARAYLDSMDKSVIEIAKAAAKGFVRDQIKQAEKELEQLKAILEE